MYLFDCGLVGRLLSDGLEQVAAEVVQPNLEPKTHIVKLVQNRMHSGRKAEESQSLVESVNGYVCS